MKNERRALLGLRYGPKDIVDYQKVMELVERNGLSKSGAGKRLIRRGLTRMDNPEPLVKEKIVEVSVEKPVFRDRYPYCKDCRGQPEAKPEAKHAGETVQEHITDEPIQEHIAGDPPKTGQRPSGDMLTIQERADPPFNKALEKEKSPDKDTNWGGLITGISLLAIGIGGLIYKLTR